MLREAYVIDDIGSYSESEEKDSKDGKDNSNSNSNMNTELKKKKRQRGEGDRDDAGLISASFVGYNGITPNMDIIAAAKAFYPSLSLSPSLWCN